MSIVFIVAGIKLVKGVTKKSGLIEVYHDGEWRSVCDDYWTDEDANVACRQLGFLGYGELLCLVIRNNQEA